MARNKPTGVFSLQQSNMAYLYTIQAKLKLKYPIIKFSLSDVVNSMITEVAKRPDIETAVISTAETIENIRIAIMINKYGRNYVRKYRGRNERRPANSQGQVPGLQKY